MAELQTLQCPNCGAQATFDPSALARTCEFCGSEFKIPVPDKFVELREKSSILPFQVDKSAAFRAFDEWLQKGLFKPGDLLQVPQRRGMEGMYVPFWSFNVQARTEWHGQLGVTRYRRVTRTRTNADGKTESYQEDEPYTEWHPRSGVHHGQYLDHIVGSGVLSQEEADRILPYDFAMARPWDADYVAGFEGGGARPSRGGRLAAAAARIQGYERTACAQGITRLDSASTEFLSCDRSLSYLPMWIFSYSYKGKPFRALVNGQTSEVQGTKPISTGKVILAVVLGIVAIAIILGIMALINSAG